MILMNNRSAGHIRGNRQLTEQNKDGRLFSFGNGKQVVVLVESVYNGPNNKAQPVAYPGDTITIAGGPYAFDLIQQGLVIAVEDYVDPSEVKKSPTGDQDEQSDLLLGVDGNAWDFWEAAGLTNAQARTLFEAGFTSAADVIARCRTEGLGVIVALKGIGQKKAQNIWKWSLVNQ